MNSPTFLSANGQSPLSSLLRSRVERSGGLGGGALCSEFKLAMSIVLKLSRPSVSAKAFAVVLFLDGGSSQLSFYSTRNMKRTLGTFEPVTLGRLASSSRCSGRNARPSRILATCTESMGVSWYALGATSHPTGVIWRETVTCSRRRRIRIMTPTWFLSPFP